MMAQEIFEQRVKALALAAGSEQLLDEFTELYGSLLAVVKEEGREAETQWSHDLEETQICMSRLKRLRALFTSQTRFVARVHQERIQEGMK